MTITQQRIRLVTIPLISLFLMLAAHLFGAKMPPQPEKFRVVFHGVHFVTTNQLWSQSEVARTRQQDRLFTHNYGQIRVLGTNDGNLLRRDYLVIDRFIDWHKRSNVIPRSRIPPEPVTPITPPKPRAKALSRVPVTVIPQPPPSVFYGYPRQQTVTLAWDTYPAFSGVPCGVFAKLSTTDPYWTKLGVSSTNRWDDAGTNSVRIYKVEKEPIPSNEP